MKRIVATLVHLLRPFGARWILQQTNRGVRKLAAATHFLQYVVEWGAQPNPEWFDHFIDQYYIWKKTGNPLPWERGIFALLAIKDDAKILELCCGDGFNSHHFYAIRSSSITALDFDPHAIRAATRNFKNAKITFLLGDIRKDMPDEKYDNIVWDAAIEHFTESEIATIMNGIKKRLRVGGILSGYTIVERPEGRASHHEHEYEFKSKEDLLRFLTPQFKHVKVFETIYPSRHNLYFYASDEATLPFDAPWPNQLVH